MLFFRPAESSPRLGQSTGQHRGCPPPLAAMISRSLSPLGPPILLCLRFLPPSLSSSDVHNNTSNSLRLIFVPIELSVVRPILSSYSIPARWPVSLPQFVRALACRRWRRVPSVSPSPVPLFLFCFDTGDIFLSTSVYFQRWMDGSTMASIPRCCYLRTLTTPQLDDAIRSLCYCHISFASPFYTSMS